MPILLVSDSYYHTGGMCRFDVSTSAFVPISVSINFASCRIPLPHLR